MFGVIEFGRMLFIYTEVSNAAREAVRYGAVRGEQPVERNYQKCPSQHPTCDICDAGNNATVLTYLEDSDFTIVLDNGLGGDVRDCLTSPAPDYVAVDGDRLVITVTYQFRPLVLFQDAGPFQDQITSARTLVGEGIALSGFDDVPAGSEDSELEVPEWFDFVHDPRHPAGCYGYFHWAPVHQADGYRLYEWFPEWTEITSTLTLTYPEQTNPVHINGIDVINGQIFYVQAYQVGDPVDLDDSAPSNYEVVRCVDQPKNLRFEEKKPCNGYFEWDEVIGAAGYNLYGPGGLVVPPVEPGDTRYPPKKEDPFGSGVYTVTAYISGGAEGFPSLPVTITLCTNPLATPKLSFQVTDPGVCSGKFNWGSVDDVAEYSLYLDGEGDPVATIPGSATELDWSGVTNNEEYYLVAHNRAGDSEPGVSGRDNWETVTGCGYQPMNLYLHSLPDWCKFEPFDHDGDPPLTMDGTVPTCGPLADYDYNLDGELPDGRKVVPGGAPLVESDPEAYLVWHSMVDTENLHIQGDVTLRLWFLNNDITSTNGIANVQFCTYAGGYDPCLSDTSADWASSPITWTEKTIVWSGADRVILAGQQLAVYLTVDGGSPPLWFMYDDVDYPSRIEFAGQWVLP
jgi:hypothetical protein